MDFRLKDRGGSPIPHRSGSRAASLRVFPNSSFAIVLAALVVAAAISANTYYSARGVNHDTTYYACLYAGSLSQVGETPPANCGRGSLISWNSEGVQGEPGQDGVSGHQQVQGTPVILSPGETNRAFVECPPDKVVLGGGAVWVDGFSETMTIAESYPAGNEWSVWVRNDGDQDELTFAARAICAFVVN